MKIKTRGAQVFNVPNDGEGKYFLRLLKRYRNRGWHYRARSRGPRKAPGDAVVSFSRSLSIPQDEADWLAVYMSPSRDETRYMPNIAPRIPTPPVPEAPQMIIHSPNLTISKVEIAEWSEPVHVGDAVALDILAEDDGLHRVFKSSLPHESSEERTGYSHHLGVAVTESQGDISAGEGTVNITLNQPAEANTVVTGSTLNTNWADVAAPPAALTEPDPYQDGSVENEVELNQAELEVLEHILRQVEELHLDKWNDKNVKSFNSLFNKLVD